MTTTRALKPEELCRRCDPNQFSFETTKDLDDFGEIIGQNRAIEAIKFGVGIRQDGYNLFALGSSAIAKHSVIRHFLNQQAAIEPTPDDWCYVNNFSQPHKPCALRLPKGRAMPLRRDIEQLVAELCLAIPAAFESEDYRSRKQIIAEEFKTRRDRPFEDLRKEANDQQIELLRTTSGIVFTPLRNGEVISSEEFQKLPESEQNQLEAKILILQHKLGVLVQQVPTWEKECREKLSELNKEIIILAVGHLIEDLKKRYIDLPAVVAHLNNLQEDVRDNADVLISPEEEEEVSEEEVDYLPQTCSMEESPLLRRYQINVVVDNSSVKGAPIVYEDNPTYQNLIGKIEYTTHMGSLMTDFTLIKGGSLHKANGGYLMLDARKMLLQPYAWDGLKRALHAGELRIESLEHMLNLANTVSLEPEVIPLNLKVVLLGEPDVYYLLFQLDDEFRELFKVMVDFDEQMDRTPTNTLLYARLIGTLAKKERLRPLERGAIARIIEQSARLVDDAEKLSTQMKTITDLLREANYWAEQAQHELISYNDVQLAIDKQIYRADRVRSSVYEEIQRGTIFIDTTGSVVGQINGLSVVQLGNFAFGQPSRITASVRLGKGEVIDIEREVAMGGPIHSKGVLILSGFLGGRYAIDQPLSLSASLVFEQSYQGVEGDSASSAELYALLSALADLPVKQALAVTGSVNQHGQIQAIGGVNEKIEGFFDICQLQGLTGQQGVLIPATNVKNLMLRQDIIEAVRAEKFHIFPIDTIDTGIEILTGVVAGVRDSNNQYPPGSVNQRVEARLIALAEKRAIFNVRASAESKL